MNLRVTAFTASLLTACVTGGALADFREGLKFFQSGNHAQAALVWQQSAEVGVPASQRNLGLLYLNDLASRKPDRGRTLVQGRGGPGYCACRRQHGQPHPRGIGIATDRRRRRAYRALPQKAVWPKASTNLAVFYEHGVGLTRMRTRPFSGIAGPPVKASASLQIVWRH